MVTQAFVMFRDTALRHYLGVSLEPGDGQCRALRQAVGSHDCTTEDVGSLGGVTVVCGTCDPQ